MDDYTGKRTSNGVMLPRKGGGLVLKDTVNNREQSAQLCNRIGCSGRLNSVKASQNSCSEKVKPSRPPFRVSSNCKDIIGTSSRNFSMVSSTKKPYAKSLRSVSSSLETDSSENSSVRDEPEISGIVSQPRNTQKNIRSSSSISPNVASRKNLNQRPGIANQDSILGRSSSVLLASRSNGQTTRANPSRHGLRNLRCSSVSDDVPSSSDSQNKRPNITKKRNSEGESSSSSSKGKKMSFESCNQGSNTGISISESRRTRNWIPSRDSGVSSVRTQRSSNNYGRTRNNLSSNQSVARNPVVLQPDVSLDSNSRFSSQQYFGESVSVLSNSLRSFVPGSPSQTGMSRSSMNLDSFRRQNMGGIAEVLSALERIEQDGELTYEQLLVLETSLFLNGLNSHDHHRDMRLDIDNMSYEELLALEERMGSVSTALTEEALSKCIETSIYQSMPLEDLTTGSDGNKDDVKCSICQDEYGVGEEVGKLRCDHKYHSVCVNQWLRLKNWCPICKSPAEPSSAS
ncbi:hypothetical protein ACFE04_009180 [Oxalis oulophora]